MDKKLKFELLPLESNESPKDEDFDRDFEFDGCAAADCPFYWGEWSQATPDNPSEWDCGCTYDEGSHTSGFLHDQFCDGGAQGCPVLALVRAWRVLGLSDDSIDDVLDLHIELAKRLGGAK